MTMAVSFNTSPAARAGIRPGDTITRVNGERVESSRGLIRAIAAAAPGSTVNLAIRRQGHEIDVSVTVGRRPLETSAEGAK